MFLSLGVNKAFDTLSWPYLTIVLRHYGFGASFFRWILALYDSPQAKIKYYGFESSFSHPEGYLPRLPTLSTPIYIGVGTLGVGSSFSSIYEV